MKNKKYTEKLNILFSSRKNNFFNYIKKIFIGQKEEDSNRQSFEVDVDGTKSFETLLVEGNYDSVNHHVNSQNFPIVNQTKRIATIEIFCFFKEKKFNEIIKEMKNNGFRPVYIEEFLSFGLKEPNLQKKFTLVCLGSPCYHLERYNVNVVPILEFSRKNDRALSFDLLEKNWPYHYRFPAVKIDKNK